MPDSFLFAFLFAKAPKIVYKKQGKTDSQNIRHDYFRLSY
jgi:hypothetical protein